MQLLLGLEEGMNGVVKGKGPGQTGLEHVVGGSLLHTCA